MNDSFVWLAYAVTYGLVTGYVLSMVGRLRRGRGDR
jgi:heme exporter protein D